MNIKLTIVLIIFFSACSSHENKQLEYVLRHAGENRIALERVLKHYQNEPEKLRAANFLIQNMVGKQTIDSSSITESQLYFDAFTAYFKKYGAYKNNVQYFICDSIKQLYPEVESSPQYIADIQHISADFLIHHIDNCFKIYQLYPWSRDINTNTFCKYILPYTTSNYYWEQTFEFFEQKYAPLRDTVSYKSYQEVARIISSEIDRTFFQNWFLFSKKYTGLLPTTFRNLVTAQIGSCLEANIYKIAALRANGIPAALNTFPGWGNADSPHFWTEIIENRKREKLYDNTQRPYVSANEILIDRMFWKSASSPALRDIPPYMSIQYCRSVSKVYRINYDLQYNSLALQAKEEIPQFFKNPGVEDITEKYIICKDIEVPLWGDKHSKKYVYLCCYDRGGWTPACWSLPHKKQALFAKVGVNVLYLPAYYDNGRIIPAGDAFILTVDGCDLKSHVIDC